MAFATHFILSRGVLTHRDLTVVVLCSVSPCCRRAVQRLRQDADEQLRLYSELAEEIQTEPGKSCGWGMLHCAIQRKAPVPFLKDLLKRTARRHRG
jgi:hypothetical protein